MMKSWRKQSCKRIIREKIRGNVRERKKKCIWQALQRGGKISSEGKKIKEESSRGKVIKRRKLVLGKRLGISEQE